MNLNMPGALENEDPNRFLQLRPVEEFRYLPIIPISDRQMADFRRRVAIWHTKRFNFLVKRDDVLNGFVALFAFLVCWKLISFVMEKNEEMMVDMDRIKINKILNS